MLLALRVVLGLLIAGQLTLAVLLWPALPASIPTHFDARGAADGWGAPDAEWFATAAFLALAGGFAGYGLPALFRRLARRNSHLLTVPDRARFQALPVAARVRAVAGSAPWLVVIGAELQLLMAFLLVGTLLVARGDWPGLPVLGLYGGLAVLLATAIGLAIGSTRAVRRELAAADPVAAP